MSAESDVSTQSAECADADEFFEVNSERYRSLFSVLFMDLIRVAEDEQHLQLLDDLYYNREQDLQKFRECLRHIRRTRGNVLVTGGAGVGKSTFVYRVLRHDQFLKETNIVPIVADYRRSFDRSALLLDVLADFSSYLDLIGHPLPELRNENNRVERLTDNRTYLLRHLATVPKNPEIPYPVIFLDDFDYLETNLFPVLEWFMGFAVSDRCSVVLTARPALYNAANRDDDRSAAFLVRNVQHVKLKPITPYKMIARRMAAVLQEDAGHPFANLARIWKRDDHPFRGWLRKMGVDSLDELRQMRLPFDTAMCTFMASVTNGNIREIMRIAETSLAFIMKNYRRLKTVEEEYQGQTVQRKHVTEEMLIDLFPPEGHGKDDGNGKPDSETGPDEESPAFRLLNVHQQRNRRGASLLFNVLEAVRDRRCLSPQFYALLEEQGHDRADVDAAVRLLEGKVHPLVETTGILPGTADEKGDRLYRQYRLTEKGEYYLSQIVYWPSYQQRFGEAGPSIHERLKA